MRLVDTHAHLNVEQFAGKEAEYIARAREVGVDRIVVVGFDEPTIKRAIELADRFDEVYLTLGWHPTEAKSYTPQVEDKLLNWLEHEKVVAVGETGLDYYWDDSFKARQQEVFRRQIELAKALDLPFTVHNRASTEDVYEIIGTEGVGAAGGIMHSFNLSPLWLERFAHLDLYLSYSGVVTFKNAPEVKASAEMTPLDRLLIETDAPYLAPEPYRGRQNEPAYVRYVAEEIARLHRQDVEEIARRTTANAARLFGWEDVRE